MGFVMSGSETGDMWRDWKDGQRNIRQTHGVNCPQCAVARPKAHPSILLPGQRCKVDGYRDPRSRLTDEQQEEATGWKIVRNTDT